MRITDEAVQTGFEGYMRIVDFFDKDDTSGSFLNEDGEGGFLGAIDRMAREIDRLRTNSVDVAAVRRQALEDACKILEHEADEFGGLVDEVSYHLLRKAKIIRSLSAEPAQGEQWSEDMGAAPSDTIVLLAWWNTLISKWEYEAGLYHSTKGGWCHGSATHWMTLPSAPTSEAGR